MFKNCHHIFDMHIFLVLIIIHSLLFLKENFCLLTDGNIGAYKITCTCDPNETIFGVSEKHSGNFMQEYNKVYMIKYVLFCVCRSKK